MARREVNARALAVARTLLGALTLIVMAAGCSTTFNETHFIETKVPSGQIPNFFRLQVSGWAAFSSARYISGYFDEDIVNQYFNEIGQPDKARLIPVAQATGAQDTKPVGGSATSAATATTSTAPPPKIPALVLLLSTNSDEIASQLGALAQSQEFTASLAALAASSHFAAADDAESRLREDQARGHVTAALGDQLVTALPDNAPSSQAQTQLLEFVNQLAGDLGSPASFKTLDDAAAWLRDNRARMRQGAGP
jgi:hypothetical protein